MVETVNTSLSSYVESASIGEAAGVAGLDSSKNLVVPGSSVIIEGATDNTFETTLTVTDPTADRVLTLPDETGTVATQTWVESVALNHTSATGNVHGIADTAQLATKQYVDTAESDAIAAAGTAADTKVSTAVSAHNSDTTEVHGIADTSLLTTTTNTQTLTNKTLTSPKINEDVVLTATSTSLNYVAGVTSAIQTQLDGKQAVVANVSSTEIGYLDGVTSAIQTQLNNKQAIVANVSDVEIGYLDGVTSSIQTQLDDKSTASKTETLTNKTLTSPVINSPTGITKTDVGLANVDNTTDASKPVSTATQTALDLKAPKADPTFTGTLVLPSTVNGPSISTSVNLLFPTQGGHITLGGSQTTGNLTLGGGASRTTGVIGIGTGATTSGTKTINVGTDSTGGTTEITIGSSSGATSNITLNGSVTAANNLVVEGDFTVNGTNFSASATSITIEDNMLQLAHQNAANTVDLGLVVAYNDGAAKHAGLVRDVSDSTWKLFKGVTTEPATTVDFTQGSLDDLAVAGLTASSLTVGSVSNTEIGYLDGVTSAIQTQINAKAPIADPTFTGLVTVAASGVAFTDGTQTREGVPSRTPIIQKTASYTLSALTERDDLIEMGSSSAMTLTIPADSTLDFPIGTSLDILQTSTGQVTIAGAGGVTVNSTPGLKLRTQWSSATLFKRAANTWVVFGDLTA